MAKPRSETPWTLESALAFIREIQPSIRELDYHILLAGGVLNTGKSEKDLDLWFIPLHGYESAPRKIMVWMIQNVGPCVALRDSPDYGPDAFYHAQEAHVFTYMNRRIDVFVL